MTRAETREQCGLSINHVSRLARVSLAVVRTFEGEEHAVADDCECNRLVAIYRALAGVLDAAGVRA